MWRNLADKVDLMPLVGSMGEQKHRVKRNVANCNSVCSVGAILGSPAGSITV